MYFLKKDEISWKMSFSVEVIIYSSLLTFYLSLPCDDSGSLLIGACSWGRLIFFLEVLTAEVFYLIAVLFAWIKNHIKIKINKSKSNHDIANITMVFLALPIVYILFGIFSQFILEH